MFWLAVKEWFHLFRSLWRAVIFGNDEWKQ